jgi:hypothetical protein
MKRAIMPWTSLARGLTIACLGVVLAGCAGGATSTTQPGAAAPVTSPPVPMAGRWILSEPTSGARCGMTFAGDPAQPKGTIAPEGGCPGDFYTSRQWTFEQDQLAIRNHRGEVLAQLRPGAGGRFDGTATSGAAVTLSR